VELLQRRHGNNLDSCLADIRTYMENHARQRRRSKCPRSPSKDDSEEDDPTPRHSMQASHLIAPIPRVSQRPKVVEPEPYHGKSMKELQEFTRVYKRAFDHDPLAYP
jgi:hypothetical protein